MIHYTLHCGNGHEFDGWFRDSAAFDDQARLGLLECPACGDARIARALMTPAVVAPRTGRQPAAAPAEQPPRSPQSPASVPAGRQPSPPAVAAAQVPAQVLAALQRLRAEIEKNCDYVGPAFPEIALGIHRGEIEPRGIYGEASPDEADMLTEEGAKVSRIPWVPRADG
jgi:hypothetical protein